MNADFLNMESSKASASDASRVASYEESAAVDPITICFTTANILTWIFEFCWVVVAWKYLNSKSMERQTLMDSQIKVLMIAWLLVTFLFQTTSALQLLGVRCHTVVAFIVTFARQGSFLWFPIVFLCCSILKYAMVKHPWCLDNYSDNHVNIFTSLTILLVIAEMVIVNIALERKLPRIYYQLQGIQGEGVFWVMFLVLEGHFIVLYGASLFIIWRCSRNGSTSEEDMTLPTNSFSDWQLIMKYWRLVFITVLPAVVLVNLSANQNLIAWAQVEPILNSYFYSVNTLVVAATITWNHLELHQYFHRKWNHMEDCVQQQVLFLRLLNSRISGRSNSIQPINLSGMT